MEENIIKVFTPTALAFTLGILMTPLITHQLYKYKAWKKKSGKGTGYGGGKTPIFDELHKEKDTNTPRMGGIVVWASVLLTLFLIAFLELLMPDTIFGKLNFLSRSQTLLPLFALVIGALVGLADDILVVRGNGKHFAGGLPLSQRLLIVAITASISAWWFYDKLEISSVSFFSFSPIELGVFFMPFFVLIALAVYASSIIDGIDGLAGGVFLFIFTAYSGIAFYQMQYDIAAFCATVVGGILAFLWFNIPPARFYMTETGVMALTLSLTIIAFMTDVIGEGEGVSMLPIVGFLLFATVAANIIQVLSKRFWGRKIFLVAPLHHHFEALGWSHAKVAMRYWVLGFVLAVLGLLLTIAL